MAGASPPLYIRSYGINFYCGVCRLFFSLSNAVHYLLPVEFRPLTPVQMRSLGLVLLCLSRPLLADIFSCGGFVKSDVPINYKNVKVSSSFSSFYSHPPGEIAVARGSPEERGGVQLPERVLHDPRLHQGPVLVEGGRPRRMALRFVSARSKIDTCSEKDVHTLNIDGQTDPCTRNEDINFVVNGNLFILCLCETGGCSLLDFWQVGRRSGQGTAGHGPRTHPERKDCR